MKPYFLYKIVEKLNKIPFIQKKINRLILMVAENYSEIYVRRKAIDMAREQVYKVIVKSFFIVICGVLLAVLTAVTGSGNDEVHLLRNDTGKGQATYEIQAEIKGEKRNIPVTLEERQYTADEVEKWFDYGCENIEQLILGENKSVNEIEEDLNLIESIPGTAIEIRWECSDYTLIQPSGQLCRENLSKEGDAVRLVAVFSYLEAERKHEIRLTVKKKTYEGIEKSFNELKEQIEVKEADTRTEEEYELPEEIEGEKVNYSAKKDYSALIILGLGIVVAILLPMREKSVVETQAKLRKRQMLLEYPQLVNKLSLYLGAGMNMGRAWEKLASDYIEGLSSNTDRSFLNEQIIYTYRQLQSGVLTSVAFDEFGNRCGLQVIKKLSLMINSNLKKGSQDLSQILQTESREAFANRKSEVIKIATEASVKLMLPMVMELVVVIGILIVPAFLSLEV